MVGKGANPRATGDRRPRARGRRAPLIRLIVVGRARGPLAAAAADYEARLRRALDFDVVEVRDEPLHQGTAGEVMERERRRLLPHLDGRRVVCLDRSGRPVDSEGLAGLVGRWETEPPQRTAVVIGGAYGLAPDLIREATAVLSLGPLTLPHQLARVVAAEQLYRAKTILRNEPYHR